MLLGTDLSEMVEGVQLSLLLLTAEGPGADGSGNHDGRSSCPLVVERCVKTYLASIQGSKRALCMTYYAVLASSQVERCLTKKSRRGLGKWCPITCGHLFHSNEHAWMGDHVTHANNCGQTWSGCKELSLLKDLSCDLAGGRQAEVGVAGKRYSLANQIHWLVDAAPVKPEDYVLISVHYVAASLALSPSTDVHLSGALLRLKEWHTTHLELILPDSIPPHQMWVEPLRDWTLVVGVDKVWSASQWAPVLSVLWRGHVNLTEPKNLRQITPSITSLPGFTLQLCPDIADSALSPSVLKGVGLCPSSCSPSHLEPCPQHYCPSHLELVQVMDMGTLPAFWLSPICCQLSLSNSRDQCSVKLFQSLLSSFDNKSVVGLLLRLCYSSTNPDSEAVSNRKMKTSADWLSSVLAQEDILQQTVHPLGSFETGPMLLVQPRHATTTSLGQDTVESHDACFLWRPDALSFTRVHQRLCEKPEEERGSWNKSSLCCDELDVSPSDWSELKALKGHEWIQRKMVRRIPTNELNFGRWPAPPPVSSMPGYHNSMGVSNILKCFTEQGMAVDEESLSPIAVTTPSKPTRMCVPALESQSFQAIMACTPTSKRSLHGIGYCFSPGDSSKDSKLTKIQHRYLISERSSNCSTISTPQAYRDVHEARRKKEAQIRAERETMVMWDRSKGVAEREQSVAGGSQSSTLITNGHTSSVTRLAKGRKKRSITEEAFDPNTHPISSSRSLSSAGKRHERGKYRLVTSVSSADKKSRTDGMGGVKGGDVATSGTRGAKCGRIMKEEKACSLIKCSPQKSDQNSADHSNQDSTIPTADPIRTTYPIPTSDTSPHSKPSSTELSLPSKGKRKNRLHLKDLLGQAVVRALKKNQLSRSHPIFKACYTQLFNLSKMFMKDLKLPACDLDKEIQRVVKLNVRNVIAFQQRLDQ